MILPLAALHACGVPTSLDSAESASRIRAMQNAAEDDDHTSIPKLIRSLESDDPAVRFFAIGSLERVTGQRLGYDPFGDEPERTVAVERWHAWYESSGKDVTARP